ncbi:MAG: efflux RND transporter periplasmic adaptor subunit [Steroidobacteraceae bacterium]
MSTRNLLAFCFALSAIALGGCGSSEQKAPLSAGGHEGASATATAPKGPHNGRLLQDGDFSVELAIFETGIPPEFHAWPTQSGKAVPLTDVKLRVELTRLGDRREEFSFAPQGDYLRANGGVHEPHSFIVHVVADHQGRAHEWTYESLEGRTRIEPPIAAAAGIETAIAGPATLVDSLTLYGKIAPDPGYQREVTARYPGLIRSVQRNLGDRVRAGETLATIESNESLQTFAATAPISGIVTARDANVGEQSADRQLFTITDPSRVWVELAIFPRDRARVKVGAPLEVRAADGAVLASGKIQRIDVVAGANQTITARASINNPDGMLVAGAFVRADVAVGERKVPLAVNTAGLQPFRDFTVVYEQVGDTYEVRMLELGEQRGEWAEVLGGLESGVRYVTANSYVIKADIEKSGASHDH